MTLALVPNDARTIEWMIRQDESDTRDAWFVESVLGYDRGCGDGKMTFLRDLDLMPPPKNLRFTFEVRGVQLLTVENLADHGLSIEGLSSLFESHCDDVVGTCRWSVEELD